MISLSPNGTTLFLSGGESREIAVGTAKGVVFLECVSSEWQISRRALEECYISALVPVPTERLLFAAAHRATIHVSQDEGRSWKRADNGIGHPHVYTLASVRIEGRIKLYAGTEPPHLYESEDLGESWHELPALLDVPNAADDWTYPPPPHIAHVKNIAFDPWDAHVMYVCVEQGGLYRSEDGGRSWQWLSKDIYSDVHRLLISPSDPNHMYVTGGDGLYASRDGGRAWEHLTNRAMRIGYPDALIMHPRREKLMFMAGAKENPWSFERDGTADSRIARSQDGGRTWEVLRHGFPNHIRANVEAMTLEAWDDDYRAFAGTTDGEVYCSGEGGQRWFKIIHGLPPISKLFHYEALAHGASKFNSRSELAQHA